MPRLTRKNIKVFAGSATNNGVFGSLQANNPTTTSDVEQLQSLSAWSDGWNAATETSEELPPLEEIQGVEYVTTYQQAYIMQEGIPEWASSVTYYKGSVVKEVTSTGFKIYNSLTDNNTGNLLSDTSNWKKVIDSDDLYAFDNTVVHNTGNETVAGVKTFTASIYRKDTNMDINVNPESQINNQIWFSDKNDNLYATLQANQNTDGSVVFALTGKSRTSNSYSTLSLAQLTDGTGYAIAPASDKNNSIVTTVSKSKAQNGYFQLGNGLIIQWGRTLVRGVTDKTIATITLPKAFTTTNYTFTGTYENNTSTAPANTDDVAFVTTSITTTQVKGFGYDAGINVYDAYIRWVAIGY